MVRRFDPGSLDMPEWLREFADSTAPGSGNPDGDVFGQPVAVDRQWWSARLRERGLPGDLLVGDSLTRRDLCGLGETAADSPADAERLLWNSLAWGVGPSKRQVLRRLWVYARDRPALAAGFQAAAASGRADSRTAYASLRGLMQYLGPAYFTKFLYFAGGGAAAHPSLILDARVAMGLREAGWSPLALAGWSAAVYGDYLDLVARWTGELDLDRGDRLESALRAASYTVPARDWRGSVAG